MSQKPLATIQTPSPTDEQDNDSVDQTDRRCCLVQIYPAEVVDGMEMMEKDTIVVGRDQQCDIWIDDGSVSRRHAEFRRVDDSYDVCDLGSTNGTLVNGHPITYRELQSGDCVKFGSYQFKFLTGGSVESIHYESIRSAMTVDAMTGALNKSYLLDHLQREIIRCQREQRPLAIVMCDIDRFKSVNDTNGHLVGDEVLIEFARRLIDLGRERDVFARYGGEEFSLVLADTDLDEVLEIAEHCREAIAAAPFTTEVGPLDITASFGVAMLGEASTITPADMIGEADQRLYEAKEAGRNRVVGPPSA